MSLRAFHIVFIVSSIVMTLVVTVWGIGMYTSGRGSFGHLLFGGGSLLAGTIMAVYLAKFVRKTREIGME